MAYGTNLVLLSVVLFRHCLLFFVLFVGRDGERDGTGSGTRKGTEDGVDG